MEVQEGWRREEVFRMNPETEKVLRHRSGGRLLVLFLKMFTRMVTSIKSYTGPDVSY